VLRGVELIGLELLAYSGVFLLLFLLVGIRRHATLRDLGLGPVPWRWMFMAVPAVVVSYALETVTGLVGNSLFPGTPNTQCRDLREAFAGYLPTAIVVVAIIAPIVEETFFRGFLLRWLRDRLPWWVALVVSAAIFSASHFSYHQPTLFLPIFGAGLVLGVLYLHSGSIWPGVAAHGFFNLIPTLVLFLGSQTCA
jgi:membrane protease YdiL (CAAX protease family)